MIPLPVILAAWLGSPILILALFVYLAFRSWLREQHRVRRLEAMAAGEFARWACEDELEDSWLLPAVEHPEWLA